MPRAAFRQIWRCGSDKAFGGGAETWLRLQMAYDLAQARQHEGDINVKPVARRKRGRAVLCSRGVRKGRDAAGSSWSSRASYRLANFCREVGNRAFQSGKTVLDKPTEIAVFVHEAE